MNVCRHRGSTVVEGAGNRKTLQCPYHAWTYGLDGRLRAAPRADFELGRTSALEPVRLERWGPFLFVNADADAEPLADWLGPVPAQVAELGLDVDALQFHHRAEWSVAANWKVVAENFLECYHCAVAHPGFSALVDVSPDAYRLEVGRLHSTQIGPARDGATRRSSTSSGRTRGSTSSPASRTCRSGRSSRRARTAPTASSTTSSAPASRRRGSPSCSSSTTPSGARTSARRARAGRRELGRDRRRPAARRRGAPRRALPGSRARRARLAAAEEPAARTLRLRLLAERARAGGDVVRRERDELVGADLVDTAGEAQRVLAQGLLEERARVPRVAEALAALRAVEDRLSVSTAPRRSGTRCPSRTSP